MSEEKQRIMMLEKVSSFLSQSQFLAALLVMLNRVKVWKEA